ncbi:MAG: 1-acyl-sn-glycerol-3-phosphate acyltransferase [Bifidobacteriaceae bacterium]|jgi:1-acyl-sn-glycerol-3-phosphate acyltransferase|nr:1-acyl-sn-glycerol-3-phosphate acyltransferase [Bifidobacteriaceae bacterium]
MFYRIIRLAVLPFFKWFFAIEIYGGFNIKKDNKVILASNHIAAADSIVLAIASHRKIHFIGKKEYFTGKGIKGKIIKYFMKGIGVIPVDRTGGQKSNQALNTALQVLNKNQLFGIYPEGTRSPDGILYKGHTGVARLAYLTGSPIVPVGIQGTNLAQPIGKTIPKRAKVIVRIGKPIIVERVNQTDINYDKLRQLTTRIMTEISKLSKQTVNSKIYGIDRKTKLNKNE